MKYCCSTEWPIQQRHLGQHHAGCGRVVVLGGEWYVCLWDSIDLFDCVNRGGVLFDLCQLLFLACVNCGFCPTCVNIVLWDCV